MCVLPQAFGAFAGRKLRWLALCACLPLLVACAGLPGTDTPPGGEQRLAVGAGHARFALSGRLSVREGQRIEMAGLRWERASTTETVTLTSPLGTTVAQLFKGEDGIARLKAGERETTAANLEALIEDALGTAVPLEALGWWIQGLASDPGTGVRRETGAAFGHAGWDIRLEEFPLTEHVPVARRIVARRGDVTLRLVIDEWSARP